MLETNKNLTCEFAEELVSYLYDELTGADKASFEKHLGNCLLCAEELSEFSSARSSILEWRNEEFLPLLPPTIEIPYENQIKTFENKVISRSWLAAVRDFFTLSPAWMTATTAFAALAICVGLFFALSSSLPDNDEVMVQANTSKIKVVPSPTNENKTNSNVSVSNETGTKPGNSPKPLVVSDPDSSQDVVPPAKAPTKPQNTNVKRQIQPKGNNRTPLKQTPQKAPKLIEDEEEDNTLRLSDLLENIGTD